MALTICETYTMTLTASGPVRGCGAAWATAELGLADWLKDANSIAGRIF